MDMDKTIKIQSEDPWKKRKIGWKYQHTQSRNSWNSFKDDISLGGSLFRDVGADFTATSDRRKSHLNPTNSARLDT